MNYRIGFLMMMTAIFIGCTSNYEEGKRAFQGGRLQEAAESFSKAKPERNSTDKEQVEAANALSVLESMSALNSRQYSTCIIRAHEVTLGEWKALADSLITICDLLFQRDVEQFIANKDYAGLLTCFRSAGWRRPDFDADFEEVMKWKPTLATDIQQAYLDLPTVDELESDIQYKKYQENEYSKTAAGCNHDMQMVVREAYGDNLRAERMARTYDDCQSRMATLRSEIAELENRKGNIANEKEQLSSLFSLLTGTPIMEKIVQKKEPSIFDILN